MTSFSFKENAFGVVVGSITVHIWEPGFNL
jgi:hypothetical protein